MNGIRFDSPPRSLTGPDVVRALTEVFNRQSKSYDPRIYVPRRVHAEASVAFNAFGNNTQGVVLTYTVPVGMTFVFKWLIQLYIGNITFVPGDGNVTFVWDIDEPLGTTPRQGMFIQGFQSSNFTYGGYNSGIYAPWELEEPEILEPNSVLRCKVTVNTVNLTTGRVIAVAGGALWPRDP